MKLRARLVAGIALAISIGCSTSDNGVADVLLVASVEVTPASSDVFLGATRQLEATPKTSGGVTVPGRTVVWSSSNPSIASVSSSGLVKGEGLGGPVVIRATVDEVIGEAQVTVRLVPVDHVVITPSQTGILVGQTLSLNAIALDASGRPLDGRTFSWQSSAPEIASVTTTGVVVGVSQGGPVTITATAEGKSGTASVSVATRPATQLAVVQQPGPSVAGQALNPAVKVALQDDRGATVVGAGNAVTIALAANPGGATLSGTTQASAVNGIVTFADLVLNRVGTGYTFLVTSPGLTSATSSAFDVSAGAASQLGIITQPGAIAPSGVALPTQPVIQLRDVAGNPVAQAGVPVTAALASGVGVVFGVTTVTTNSAGTATFANLGITGPAGSYTLGFSSPGLTGATSSPILLSAGAPAALSITIQPTSSAQNGVPLSQQPAIQLRDAAGNPVAQSGVVVSAAIASGGGTLGGATSATTGASGLATFQSLAINGVAGVYTLRFTSTGLTAVVSASIVLGAGAPSQLAVTTQPSSSAQSGQPFAVQPAVQLRDASGNPVTVAGVSVTAAVSAGGSLLGTAVITTNGSGVAGFTNLAISGLAGQYTLTFSSSGLTPATSAAITLGAGAATQLGITTQPSAAAQSGIAFPQQPVIQLRDGSGNPVAQAGTAVTAALASGPAGGTLGGTLTATTGAGGAATYSNLAITGPTGTYTIRFTATGLTAVVSSGISLGAGAARTIAANSATSQSAAAGTAVAAPPSVRVTDVSGNPVPAVSVTFTVTAGGGATVPASPAVVSTNSAGVATLTSWTLGPTAGSNNNTLTASASGLTGSPVTFTASATVGAARTIAANSATSQSAPAGTAVAAPPSVKVTDAGGNPVSGVAVTFTVTAGGGASVPASPAVINTNTSGVATLTSWTLGPTAGSNNNTLTASVSGLIGSPVTFTASASAGAATAIAANSATSQSGTVGTPVSAPPSVRVTDAGGNPVSGVAVTFTLTGGGGSTTPASPAVVSTNASGVATLTSWTLGPTAGTNNNTLTASASGLTGSPVTFTASATVGAARTIAAASATSQSATVGTAVSAPPSVRVTDAGGNPVSGVAVTFAVTGGGGTSVPASPAVVSTNASGVATLTSWTLGPTAGTNNNTLTASASGLTGSPVTFTASGTTGTATTLAANSATAQSATVGTAVGAPPSVKVTDAGGNPVSGVPVTFTVTAGGGASVPASPAVVSTNASGVATLTSWTLGPTAGSNNNTLTASASGLTGSPVIFTASGTTGTATTLAANSATAQSATVGTAVGAPPSVKVTDAGGNPVSGVSVTFTLTGGGGSTTPASPAVVSTNASGVATLTSWTLGPTAGTNNNTLTASASGLTGSPVIFTASGTTGTATTLVANSATSQSGTVGSAVGAPPSVKVSDAGGNPVSGVAVTFTVTGGGGTSVPASPAVVSSSASGVATLTSWTLGPTAGTNNNTLTASASGLAGSPVTFTASALAGPADHLTITTQPSSTAAAGSAFAQQPVLQLRDAGGNAVSQSGVSVAATIASGPPGATLGGTTSVLTNGNGAASYTNLSITGLPGDYTLGFAATGLTGLNSGTITITAVSPSRIGIITQPPSNAANGAAMSPAPVVQLQDAGGNPVPSAGVPITISIASGSGSLDGTTTVNTDAFGRATFSGVAIIGTVGSFTLGFSSAGLTGATSNTVVLGPGAATQLSITTQPSATAQNNTVFAQQPVIQLLDSGGNPVGQAGVTVSADLTSGTGPLAGDRSETTDASGVATFTSLKIQSPGTYTIRFTSGSLTAVVSTAIVVN
jgi:adhesin/invasin